MPAGTPQRVLLCAALLGAASLPAQTLQRPDSVQGKNPFSAAVTFETVYNDNILDYSPSDLARFDNYGLVLDSISRGLLPARDTARYSIGHVFDKVSAFRLRFTFAPAFFQGNPTAFRFRLSRTFHAGAAIRDYMTAGFEVRQTFLRKNTFSVGMSVLPSYYLRNYLYVHLKRADRLPTHYMHASFSRRTYSFEAGRTFSQRLSASAGYDNETTEYNAAFAERSSTTDRLDAEIALRAAPPLRVRSRYAYEISWARGREMSDSLSDVSSLSHRWTLGLSASFKSVIHIPLTLDLDGTVERQTFLSGKLYDPFTKPSGDKFHYRRLDHLSRVSFDAGFELARQVEVHFLYTWEQNVSNLEEGRDIGSYQTHEAGVAVGFSF